MKTIDMSNKMATLTASEIHLLCRELRKELEKMAKDMERSPHSILIYHQDVMRVSIETPETETI